MVAMAVDTPRRFVIRVKADGTATLAERIALAMVRSGGELVFDSSALADPHYATDIEVIVDGSETTVRKVLR